MATHSESQHIDRTPVLAGYGVAGSIEDELAQLRAVFALAAGAGYRFDTETDWHCDLGSGAAQHRPRLDSLFSRIEDYDVLCVASVDVLSEDPLELFTIGLDLDSAAVRLLLPGQPESPLQPASATVSEAAGISWSS